MTFEVGVVGQFNARHHLVGDFGAACEPHEHRYRVEAEVVGAVLGADGTLFDITVLQTAVAAAVDDLNGQDLNEFVMLASPNPTAEVVARFFFDCLAAVLGGQGLGHLRTRVWESDEAYASYTGDLA
jgi:6-pyruvoyltetrahydropterin/6-carboxytetrahydropterin synthase